MKKGLIHISDSKVALSIKSKPKLSIRPNKRPCKCLTEAKIGDNLSLSQKKFVQFFLSCMYIISTA